MNNLNSLILEGILTADPVIIDKKCDFNIESTRFIKLNGTRHEETITVRVKIADTLVEDCEERLKKGRTVRVVGRLSQDDQGIFLAGEHIETKAKKDDSR